MKISIVGTGAIGGYYGIMLAKAGYDVHFLLRSDFEYVSANGLQIQSKLHQDIYLPNVNAYKNAEDMPQSDIVLVALKTTQNDIILPKILAHLASEKTTVILIQNGLGMEENLAKQLPQLQIAGAVALISSYKTESGTVIHQDYGNLDLGNYNLKDISILNNFTEQLIAAGIPSTLQDLKILRWKKLVWNMAFNGLSVVLNKTTDQILSDPGSLTWCKAIMAEVVQAAKVCGIILPENIEEQMIAFTQKMSSYYPSMKLDFNYSRPMELKYMYENPINNAAVQGYEMTETKKLYNELKKLNIN